MTTRPHKRDSLRRLERRIVRAAMRSFERKLVEYGGLDRLLGQSMTKDGQVLIRACAAHAKAKAGRATVKVYEGRGK